MTTPQRAFRIAYSDATSQLASANTEQPSDQRFVTLAERLSLSVELYQPQKSDFQTPHERDECYVITEGSGMFEMDGAVVPFLPGDFFFVAAGVPHRFVDCGESMTCWVIFYGPAGGETISG